MEIVRRIFDEALVIKLRSRIDNRGIMTAAYEESFRETGFVPKETRIYTMPEKGTFFGIHFRDKSSPMSKLVAVIRGRGADYIVDLRKDSSTYLKWEKIELSAENALAVLIPAGLGHGFQALEDDTIQLYSIDRSGDDGYSRTCSYLDERIGLKPDIPVTAISDYDIKAELYK